MRLYKASYVHERYKECYEARRKAVIMISRDLNLDC